MDAAGTVTTGQIPILPLEILQRIAGEYAPQWQSHSILSREDIVNLSCTSRQLQVVAEYELYRNISVVCHDISLFRPSSQEAQFSSLESLCLALFLSRNGPQRRTYFRRLTFFNLRYVASSLEVLILSSIYFVTDDPLAASCSLLGANRSMTTIFRLLDGSYSRFLVYRISNFTSFR